MPLERIIIRIPPPKGIDNIPPRKKRMYTQYFIFSFVELFILSSPLLVVPIISFE